jgi:hypothetical protein
MPTVPRAIKAAAPAVAIDNFFRTVEIAMKLITPRSECG